MTTASDPRENQLLAGLTDDIFQRWAPNLVRVPMPLGRVLSESRGNRPFVYFPTTAIASLLYVMEDGASAAIAIIGNEGMVGISLLMGGDSPSSRTIVQSAGAGYRMDAEYFKREFNRSSMVLHLSLRYTQALITQMAQTAACNRHHSLDHQLCRWLLLSLDRLHVNKLEMTQRLIANMLGVRREGVAQAAQKLQDAGWIHYSRGHITVVNREELEKHSCECYEAVKQEYDRLLPKSRRNGHVKRSIND
jgi:CRP-like cAMP-binding protein